MAFQPRILELFQIRKMKKNNSFNRTVIAVTVKILNLQIVHKWISVKN